MKKIFKIYRIIDKDVCVPSDDYYSRRGDWQTETLYTLSFVEDFETEEEAVQYINFDLLESNPKEVFIILPSFTKSK